jgi:FtsH-binding integral membrane protein
MSRLSREVHDGGGGSEIELEPLTGKARPGPELVSLASPSARGGFVRKVFGILSVQLAVSTALAGMVVLHGREWLRASPSLVLAAVTASTAASLAIVCVFSCCPDVMRRCPVNYLLLAAFTLAEGLLVGFVCLQYSAGSVLLCFCLTAFVVCGLVLHATTTKTDMTGHGPHLLCALLATCGFGVALMVISALGGAHSATFGFLQTLYAAAGALVFSLFIVHDTQMIMGGNHEREFSIDDYAMAAIVLYLDVIQLFLALLRLIGSRDGDGL